MRKVYACDLETTTDPTDCRVWAWQYMNIEDFSDTKQGTKLEDFMTWMFKQKDIDIYFHNLRFDGSFLLSFLLKNGFTFDRSAKPKKNTFKTIISELGQWYAIDITLGYESKGKGKQKRQHIKITDSAKKLPMRIKNIAETFKLPVLKGEIDYHSYRAPNHVLTDEEKIYLHADVEILARALKTQYDEGLTSMTIGSDALSYYKETIDGRFDKYFPQLSVELDEFLRLSYKGGFTWFNPLFQGKIIIGGVVFDVNSLYPSRMMEEIIPYGEPIRFNGQYQKDEKYPLYIAQFKAEFTLKKAHIPTIQIKGGRFMDNEYLTSSDGEQQLLTMTSVDIQLMFDHYEVYNIEWIEGYKFRAVKGFFKKYIEHWNFIKESAKKNKQPGLALLAKLMLNNLYGKFGKNRDITPKLPYLKENGALGLSLPKDENGNIIREYTDPVYIPVGSFITAYARNMTIRTAQKCYPRIIYCDTDSIHLKGKEFPEAIADIIDDTKLGYWAHECTFEKAKFLRQKTYVERYYKTRYSDKKQYKFTYLCTDIKCSGMPDEVKKSLTFDEFKIGYHHPKGRKKPKQVNGGVVLINEPFTIK